MKNICVILALFFFLSASISVFSPQVLAKGGGQVDKLLELMSTLNNALDPNNPEEAKVQDALHDHAALMMGVPPPFVDLSAGADDSKSQSSQSPSPYAEEIQFLQGMKDKKQLLVPAGPFGMGCIPVTREAAVQALVEGLFLGDLTKDQFTTALGNYMKYERNFFNEIDNRIKELQELDKENNKNNVKDRKDKFSNVKNKTSKDKRDRASLNRRRSSLGSSGTDRCGDPNCPRKR